MLEVNLCKEAPRALPSLPGMPFAWFRKPKIAFKTSRCYSLSRKSVGKITAPSYRSYPSPAALALMLLLAASLFCAASSAGTEPAGQSAASLPTLTTARQAHSLSNDQALRGYPVHLRGVVTYFDPDFGTGYAAIFIHDSTGSVFVKPL